MEVTRKQSPSNFPKNEHFLPPTCACQEVRNVRFFGKFGVLCFLVTSILRFVLPKNHFHCVKKQQKKLSLNTGIYGLAKTLDSGIVQAVFIRTTHNSHYVNGNSRPVGILKKSKFFEKCARRIPTYFWVFFQEARTAVWSKKTLIT